MASIDDGVRWFSLPTPITLNAGDVVKVRTRYTSGSAAAPKMALRQFTAVPGFAITVDGNNQEAISMAANLTNSNLRVSALGASVAPEPGTLALAFTGGCALVGMYIRRRKAA